MIQRRQFLGSLTAACAAPVLPVRLYGGSPEVLPGPWRCDVIQTKPREYGKRAPVVTGVALQPDGQQVAIVGDDHEVCIYDLGSQSFIHHLREHTDWVRAARFSPDGQWLATCGNDRKLRLWMTSGYDQRPFVFPHAHAVIDVAIASDSRRLATVGFSNQMRVYDAVDHRLVNQLTCDCPDNHAVAFSADDRLLAAGGRSGIIRVWESESGLMIDEIRPHRQRIRSIQFTSDNRIVSCGDDQLVSISAVGDEGDPIVLPKRAAKLYAVELMPQNQIATAGSDNQIHIWSFADSKQVEKLTGHTGTVSCLDFAAGKLASGSYDTQVRVWHQDDLGPIDRQTKLEDGWNRRPLN